MPSKKGKVLLFGAESCGTGDPDLGYAILASVLEVLPEQEVKPVAMIFWNTAVKLLAKRSPLLPHIKKMELEGVKILAGRLCVTDIGLELGAGQSVGMAEMMDVIMKNEVVSL